MARNTKKIIFGFTVLIIMVCQTRSEAEERREYVMKQTLPIYAIALYANDLNNTVCHRELNTFRKAMDNKKLWSLKMLDSSGEPKPGFIYGNNYWLGVRSQCLDSMNKEPLIIAYSKIVNNSKYRDVNEEYPPFDVNYFVAHFRHNSTVQYHVGAPNENLVTLGLCLPASCTIGDIGLILNGIFRKRTLIVNDLYDADFRLIEVKDMQDDHLWIINSRLIFIGFIFALILGMAVVGTTYDILVYQKHMKIRRIMENFENNNTVSNSIKYTLDGTENAMKQKYHQGIFGKILLYFSIYTNTKIIFNTKLNKDSVPAVHGLRFLGMIWIIMIHTIFYMSDYADNKSWSWRMSEGFATQVISNSTFSVDTFFFLSGFLISYMYLKSKKGKEESKPVNYGRKVGEFVVPILRRFIRLTPAYMMTMGILELNSGWYNKTSQFYMTERPHELCAKYWWRNILYINNLFGRDTMCMSWSWYLSNDMQFFIIGMFLLILSSIYFYATVIIILLLLFGSTVITGYLSYANNYVPTLDEQYRMLDILYDPPWTRIGPYLIGMMTAYIIIRLNNKLPLGKCTVIILWCLGSSLNLLVLFGLSEKRISVLEATFYVGLSRTVWAVGIAWILIACCTNHGGIVNKILSFRGWVPFSRITYCAYLLNPFIINSVYLYKESATHVNFLQNCATFLGNFVATYFCAYVFSLILETPNILLMRLLVNNNGKKR